MSILCDLQEWYQSQCNNDWEHQYGIEIGTLDNPGWSLKIDLANTNLTGKPFLCHKYGVGKDGAASGDNWITCKVENDQYIAFGGSGKLEEMINVFLSWGAKAA